MSEEPGTAVETLEREFAAWLGAAGAVVTGFGRSALLLALEAAGVRGGEVAVPDFICAQVPEAVRRAGARPIFYRVGSDLTVRPEDFEASITAQTRGAIVAHYFGRVLPEMDSLAAACRQRGISLIEDCALALNAGSGNERAGKFGDFTVFSFTKSDWCYGGGMVTANSSDRLVALRKFRAKNFHAASKLSWCYGALRRADFTANRPSLSRAATTAGRWLERVCGLGEENFYDAGRFDSLMSNFAARRARRILAGLAGVAARRHEIHEQLTEKLRDVAGLLFLQTFNPSDNAAFVLICSAGGRAKEFRERADREGVTLRLCWPAFQSPEEGQASEILDWLASHLLIFEVHPRLMRAETEKIARVLRQLAGEG